MHSRSGKKWTSSKRNLLEFIFFNGDRKLITCDSKKKILCLILAWKLELKVSSAKVVKWWSYKKKLLCLNYSRRYEHYSWMSSLRRDKYSKSPEKKLSCPLLGVNIAGNCIYIKPNLQNSFSFIFILIFFKNQVQHEALREWSSCVNL